jgi:aerobic-type carbon monoxide dehydrogenase small subunit (CoxS/CutS family)
LAGHDDEHRGGITRRQLFKGLGTGAVATGLLGGGLLDEIAGVAEAAAAGPAVVGPGPVRITLTLNGQPKVVSVEPRTTLLELLRGDLDLTGAKPACERGACGACTVIVDGMAVDACLMLALDAWGRSVTTVEGLEHGGRLAPIQQAFVEHDALQCGFCTPGMVMSCHALLAKNPRPVEADVKHAVAGNLCRCGTYPKVVAATLSAAGKKA